MTKRTLLLFGGCVAVLIGCWGVVALARDPIAALTKVHATELPADASRAHWYVQSAKCLGFDTVYDTKLRYFTGATIPPAWKAPVGEYGGYTNVDDHLILLGPSWVNDSTLIVHEQLHDARGHKSPSHPQQYFSGRCGVFPGHD